jgi:hypothetical protein
MAVKRGKTCNLIDDVALCVQMGWTLEELEAQPSRFIEKLQLYLSTLADLQERESRRFEEELHRHRRR